MEEIVVKCFKKVIILEWEENPKLLQVSDMQNQELYGLLQKASGSGERVM